MKAKLDITHKDGHRYDIYGEFLDYQIRHTLPNGEREWLDANRFTLRGAIREADNHYFTKVRV